MVVWTASTSDSRQAANLLWTTMQGATVTGAGVIGPGDTAKGQLFIFHGAFTLFASGSLYQFGEGYWSQILGFSAGAIAVSGNLVLGVDTANFGSTQGMIWDGSTAEPSSQQLSAFTYGAIAGDGSGGFALVTLDTSTFTSTVVHYTHFDGTSWSADATVTTVSAFLNASEVAAAYGGGVFGLAIVHSGVTAWVLNGGTWSSTLVNPGGTDLRMGGSASGLLLAVAASQDTASIYSAGSWSTHTFTQYTYSALDAEPYGTGLPGALRRRAGPGVREHLQRHAVERARPAHRRPRWPERQRPAGAHRIRGHADRPHRRVLHTHLERRHLQPPGVGVRWLELVGGDDLGSLPGEPRGRRRSSGRQRHLHHLLHHCRRSGHAHVERRHVVQRVSTGRVAEPHLGLGHGRKPRSRDERAGARRVDPVGRRHHPCLRRCVRRITWSTPVDLGFGNATLAASSVANAFVVGAVLSDGTVQVSHWNGNGLDAPTVLTTGYVTNNVVFLAHDDTSLVALYAHGDSDAASTTDGVTWTSPQAVETGSWVAVGASGGPAGVLEWSANLTNGQVQGRLWHGGSWSAASTPMAAASAPGGPLACHGAVSSDEAMVVCRGSSAIDAQWFSTGAWTDVPPDPVATLFSVASDGADFRLDGIVTNQSNSSVFHAGAWSAQSASLLVSPYPTGPQTNWNAGDCNGWRLLYVDSSDTTFRISTVTGASAYPVGGQLTGFTWPYSVGFVNEAGEVDASWVGQTSTSNGVRAFVVDWDSHSVGVWKRLPHPPQLHRRPVEDVGAASMPRHPGYPTLIRETSSVLSSWRIG